MKTHFQKTVNKFFIKISTLNNEQKLGGPMDTVKESTNLHIQ